MTSDLQSVGPPGVVGAVTVNVGAPGFWTYMDAVADCVPPCPSLAVAVTVAGPGVAPAVKVAVGAVAPLDCTVPPVAE
jgi:hypothetical protein